MKHYKEVEVPARISKVTEKVTCDLCGREGREGWEESIYDVNETEVKISVRHDHGENYPDGGSVTTTEVDLCPTCFAEKLIPWLTNQGVKIREETVDY